MSVVFLGTQIVSLHCVAVLFVSASLSSFHTFLVLTVLFLINRRMWRYSVVLDQELVCTNPFRRCCGVLNGGGFDITFLCIIVFIRSFQVSSDLFPTLLFAVIYQICHPVNAFIGFFVEGKQIVFLFVLPYTAVVFLSMSFLVCIPGR